MPHPSLSEHALARRQCLSALSALAALPWLPGCAVAPAASAPAPAAVNTDPRLQPGAGQPPLVLPEPANPALPSLFMIGDSTVRNGRDDGQGQGAVGQWGWGHVLARYLDAGRINVVNRAIGGLSSRTYRTGGHWDRTRAFIRRGDTVLIQFGHNDSSPVNDHQRARGTLRGTGPETQTIDNQLTGQRETVASYGAYLRAYVADIRALGATPVLCAPVPRKRRDEQGRTPRGSGSYASWAATVAREEGVACLDLDEAIATRYDALGPAVVDRLFPRSTPEERTHTNWAGAALNAQVVAAGLQRQRLLPEPVFSQRFAWPGEAAPAEVAPAAASGPAPTAAKTTLNPRLPTVFVVGDSTVRSAGQGGFWGWGERLGEHLDATQVNLANHAMGGRSSRTFWREGRWAAVRAQLKPGDLVLIQFGHNDGGRVGDPAMKQRGVLPGVGPETQDETLPDGTVETVLSFGAYLTRYLREALAAGAVPVVLAPIPHKDRWENGRDFANFADWGRSVAQREGGYFIDLTMIVTERYRALGAAAVETFFADARTHTNDAGARLNAACVAQGLQGLPGGLGQPWLKAPG